MGELIELPGGRKVTIQRSETINKKTGKKEIIVTIFPYISVRAKTRGGKQIAFRVPVGTTKEQIGKQVKAIIEGRVMGSIGKSWKISNARPKSPAEKTEKTRAWWKLLRRRR